MRLWDLLWDLDRQQVRIEPAPDGRLRVKAQEGRALAPELLATILAHKSGILALLEASKCWRQLCSQAADLDRAAAANAMYGATEAAAKQRAQAAALWQQASTAEDAVLALVDYDPATGGEVPKVEVA